MKALTTTLVAVFLLVLSPTVRGAQIPAGTYQASFNSANGDLLIFDLSGSYHQTLTEEVRTNIDQNIADALDALGLGEHFGLTLIDDLLGGLSFDYSLQMDSKGKLIGQGTLSGSLMRTDLITGPIEIGVGINVQLTGQLKTSGKVTRLTANLKGTGGEVFLTVGILTATVNLDAPLRLELILNGPSGRVTGKATGKITGLIPALAQKHAWKVNRSVSSNLPSTVTGGWNLLVNLEPLGAKYGGHAFITLANNVSVPMTVTGTYSGRNDTSNLSLKGEGAFTGAKLDIRGLNYSGPSDTATFLYNAAYKANLMGQSFLTRPTPPAPSAP